MAHALAAQTPSAVPATAADERLPQTVVPSNYELHLHPDADRLVFSAQVRIDVRVIAPVSAMVLNAKELVFDEVTLDGKRKAVVKLDAKLEQASLNFADSVSPGTHSLLIRYHGAIIQSTLGFFAMDYESSSGKHRILATNFEPASERSLMPSWDEPAFKATFRVSVDAPASLMAVSNMPIEAQVPIGKALKRVRFAVTPRMSTYLLFLAIGDYERIAETVDGIVVGVVVAKGEAGRGRYALSQAVRLMHYYNDYFGVRFPLPKLDLVAAPGEIEGGSMENWGSIFYSQDDVLFDPKTSTEEDRRQVFLVVAHEMAHQWFGDLVTMSWWDNLWLNEGFASWMETKAPDDLHPDWKMGLQRLSVAEVGMRADAKASTHPVEQPVASAAEAELAFDSITYDKGAAVIGMLEDYIGPEQFRAGVRDYMRTHAYGNTVSGDLWEALQTAAGKPVRGIADDFTRRAGLPLLTVANSQESGRGGATLAQSRFFEAHVSEATQPPVEPWRLPFSFKSLEQVARDTTLLTADQGAIAFSGAGPLVVNAGRKSYVRVRYSAPQFDELAARFGALAPADQIGMLDDAWALGQSQYAPITHLLTLIEATPRDADPVVWLRVVRILRAIDFLYVGLPGQAMFRDWARSRLTPLAARIGWNRAPNEAPTIGLLRMPLIIELGRLGDQQVIAEARQRYAAAVADPASQPPEATRGAREIVASNADAATFSLLLEKLHSTQDPLEKQNLLEAITQVSDPALAQQLLQIIVGSDVPAGSLPDLLLKIAEVHPDLTWQFVVSHVDTPGFPVDRFMQLTIIPLVPAASANLSRVQDLQSYAAAHLPAAAARSVESAVAQIQLNARVRTVELPQIDTWLKATQP
jgi:aminopeptidase N